MFNFLYNFYNLNIFSLSLLKTFKPQKILKNISKNFQLRL